MNQEERSLLLEQYNRGTHRYGRLAFITGNLINRKIPGAVDFYKNLIDAS